MGRNAVLEELARISKDHNAKLEELVSLSKDHGAKLEDHREVWAPLEDVEARVEDASETGFTPKRLPES